MIQAGDIVEFNGQHGVQYEVTNTIAGGGVTVANLLHRSTGKTIPNVPVGLLIQVGKLNGVQVGIAPSWPTTRSHPIAHAAHEGVYIACAQCNRKYAVSSPTSSRLLKCGRCGTDQCQNPHCCT